MSTTIHAVKNEKTKGITVTESTATVTAKKTAEKVAHAIESVSPSVVETVEVAAEIPAKLVINQKLVVVASVLAGTGLGVLGFWGYQKFRNRDKTVVEIPNDLSEKNNANTPN